MPLGVADAVVQPVDDDAERVGVEVDLHVDRGVGAMQTTPVVCQVSLKVRNDNDNDNNNNKNLKVAAPSSKSEIRLRAK